MFRFSPKARATNNGTCHSFIMQSLFVTLMIGLWSLQSSFLKPSSLIQFVDARAILGVDLGSLYMKVALVQSGSPLEIVTNMHSKRKTEQLILFDNDSRYYGADAAALLARKSHITPAAMSVMLGRDEQHPTVQVLAERHYPIRPEYNESRSGVTLTVDGHVFTPEELVAMVLSHAVDISVAYAIESGGKAITPPKDVVLTVPSFSTQKERQALLDAAELASLNVLTLIDETTAAALHYAMDKNFEKEKEQLLLFYNMGGSSLQVSLVRFFNYDQPQRYGAPKSTPALEVLAKAWDSTLGGDAIDHVIVEMMVEQFNTKLQESTNDPTKDVQKNARAMMKIRLQANKVKHVLSANNEIPIHMDSVYEDVSLSMTITRAQLEEALAKSGMLERAIKPVLRVFQLANKTVADLNGTELLGGGMRVPRIQAELHKVVNTDQPLGLHINADESFALGAAFAGANISTAFRVRQVGMVDINPFPIQVTLKDSASEDEKKGFFGIGGSKSDKSNDDEEKAWSKQALIFKPYGKMGIKKTIAFTHDKDVECALDYAIDGLHDEHDTDPSSSLFPAGTEPALERYQIKGIQEFVKDMTNKKLLNATTPKPKVSLQFELSSSGIAGLVKAEVMVEEYYIAQEAILVDDDDDNSTDTTTNSTNNETESDETQNGTDTNTTSTTANNSTNATNTEKNGTSTDKKKTPKKKKKTVMVDKTSTSLFGIQNKRRPAFVLQEKKRIHKKTLDVKTYYISRVKPHSPELLAESKAKLFAMAQRDKDRMMLQEAKNKVESYVYKIKNYLLDHEDLVASVTTQEQRDEVSQLAANANEWLEEDGYDADLKTLDEKYDELSVPFEKILLRITEQTARPAAIEALNKKLVEIETLLKVWNETKPHITEDERNLIQTEVDEIRKWLDEKIKEQDSLDPHAEPVFLSTDIPNRTMLVEALVVSTSKKPEPKPPKTKKNKKNATSTSNETDTNETSTTFTMNGTSTDEIVVDGDEDNTTTTSTNSSSEDGSGANSNTPEDVPPSGAEEEL